VTGQHSGSENRTEEIRFVLELVVRALVDIDDWRLVFTSEAIDQNKLSVMDVSSHGGSKTYKVTAGTRAFQNKT
jgi:hypothetical protein